MQYTCSFSEKPKVCKKILIIQTTECEAKSVNWHMNLKRVALGYLKNVTNKFNYRSVDMSSLP
jgi:hypothetical protein